MKIPRFRATARFFSAAAGCGGRVQSGLIILGVAMLSETAWSAPNYATAVLSDNPVAFWQLNETGDPSSGTLPAADSSGNGFNATYGATARNGFNGALSPQPASGYPGFATGQGALETGTAGSSDTTSIVTVPPLNISTNVVDTTIVMWINANNSVPTATGLLFDRTTDAASRAGLGFGGAQDGSGNTDLGYNWNDTQATWGWNSPLYVPLNTWCFVALVVQSNKATIYLDYVDGSNNTNILSAVNTAAHTAVPWSAGTIWLGGDPYNGGGNRVFPGSISGAAIYHSALSSDQLLAMFAAGVGAPGFAPSITVQPQSQSVLSGSPVTLSATGIGGTPTITYQWKLNGTNINLLADSANFVGGNSNVLTVLSASSADAGSYQLFLTNSIGFAVSSNATLAIQSAALVGHWFTNNTLADTSGYQPTGTHDGYDINGTASFVFTNDVPYGKTGQSLWFFGGDTGIAISNSAIADANYTNTFDTVIHNAFTVGFYAKGWPATWNPFVSKYGESGLGWQLRRSGGSGYPAWTIRGTGDNDDMGATTLNIGNDTNNWHFYVGTYDAATHVRNLYVDGALAVSETNNGPYTMSPYSHLCIGARDNGTNTFGNYFIGEIYDVRIYNYAYSPSQVLNWYGAVAPSIASQPVPTAVFIGSKANFAVTASGTPPLTYQWQLNGTNLNLMPDAANFTGITSNLLTVLNVSSNDIGSYRVIVTSTLGYGTVTSSNAVLSIVPKVLLGEWFTNGDLTDLSGHTPPGTHDAYSIGGGNYTFVNDLPPGFTTGQSIQFGSSADSGMAIANTATTDGATYTNTFDTSAISVAFWAKDRGPFGGNWHAWVAKDGYNNNGEYNGIGWSVGIEAWSQHIYFDMEGIDNGGIGYTLGDGLWGNGILESSPQGLPGDDTSWHHYATTYNPETGIRRMYMDGTLVAEQTGNAPYAKAPDKHLTINAQEQTSHGFTGFNRTTMFDVRVYNYALTPAEILQFLPDPVVLTQPPQTFDAYIGVTEQLKVKTLTHTSPVTNQWQLNGTNLVDGAFGGATLSGVHSTVLTIANVTTNLQGVYRLVVSDPGGTTISSNCVVTVFQTAPVASTNLVGEWVAGVTNLTDTSGYSPAGTHDGRGVSGAGVPSFGYSFTNDVPSGETGNSLVLIGNTAIAITNSSDLDGAYTNTYDDIINTNGMTVMCWAKGLPGAWNPWVSKYGESGSAWQLRVNGDSATPCWTIRGPGGDDMSSTIGKSDGNWHHYAGTYDPIAGIRNLYVDGVLAAQETGQGGINASTSSHVAIGGRDSGGNSFGNYFTGRIYGVRIYNTALSEAQINSQLIPKVLPQPVLNPPLHIGNQLVLSWSTGTLLQATNLLGPWTPTGATSPYTNDVTTNAPRMFYRVSNP